MDWMSMSSSKGSSWLRDGIHVFCVSCISRQILYHWGTWEAWVSKEITESEWGHRLRPRFDSISVLVRRDTRELSLFTHTHTHTHIHKHRRHSKKAAVWKPERECSLETKSAHPDLGCPASRIVRNKCLLLTSSRLWYSAVAAETYKMARDPRG